MAGISDDKMTHILRLMFEGLKKAGMVEFPNEEEAFREARKACLLHMKDITAVGDRARARILSQKNPPMEHTAQWENLYQKYLEEELRKKGG